MMYCTGVKSVIFRKLFLLIERIGHQFRRRVPAMQNAGNINQNYESFTIPGTISFIYSRPVSRTRSPSSDEYSSNEPSFDCITM